MQKIDLEIEAIQIAIYINIVQNLLHKHQELSLNKTLTFSYLIKAERFSSGQIYNSNTTHDIVCKAISMISGEYEEYCNSVKYILKAIHILIKCRKIMMIGSMLYASKDMCVDKAIYEESAFMKLAIEASKRMTDRQFLKEVTASV